jgi:hypothetical protein
MIRSNRSGFINQSFPVSQRSKTGTFTDEAIRGYEEIMSLASDNTVSITFIDDKVVTATLGLNTCIAFNDAKFVTSSGDIIIS